MKQKNAFYLFILYSLLKSSFQQPIIIPIEPGLDVEHNENSNNDNEQDGDKPIIVTKEITGNDGQHIKITRIHYHKTKNLNGDSEAITPFQIIRIFDNRVNSIFDDIIRQSFKSFFNIVENSDDDNSDDDTDDLRQKKINKRRNKKYNRKKDGIDEIFDEIEKQFDFVEENQNKINNGEENKNKEKNDSDNKKNVLSKETKSKNGKSNEKSKVIPDMSKSPKKKTKLSRKQLIFSRVCKYIFYMIILFGFYWLIKKLLEFLEIIDPDGATEVKIQDEETTNLKKTENKQS